MFMFRWRVGELKCMVSFSAAMVSLDIGERTIRPESAPVLYVIPSPVIIYNLAFKLARSVLQ